MKLYIEEKIFTLGNKFSVFDEQGNEKYYVEGEIFTFGNKLHVYDLQGHEVAYIEQELLTWMPRYHVYVGGREVAQICREFTFFTPKYRVDGLDWDVTGHFLEHDYEITRMGRPVVTIEKEWMTWGDCYELNIADPADELAALAVVITIDCVNESRNNN